jgi:hypothetical protein
MIQTPKEINEKQNPEYGIQRRLSQPKSPSLEENLPQKIELTRPVKVIF